MAEFIAMLRGLVKPREYLEPRPELKGFLIRFLIILIICAGVLALTRWLGPEDPVEITSMQMARLATRSGPLGRLLFPLAWSAMVLFAAGLRYLAIVIMDETNKSFKDVLLVSAFAYLPMILISGLIGGVVNNLFPASLETANFAALFTLRNIVQMLVFVVTIGWELFIWNRAGRLIFEQNRGRAFMTFVAPYAFGMVFCCAPMVLLLNFAT